MRSTLRKTGASVLIFKIPHVSHLMLFQDCVSKPRSIVKLMGELLKQDSPKIRYMGYMQEYYPDMKLSPESADSALVSVAIYGDRHYYTSKTQGKAFFASELLKVRRAIVVQHKTIDPEKHVIRVSIEFPLSKNKLPVQNSDS